MACNARGCWAGCGGSTSRHGVGFPTPRANNESGDAMSHWDETTGQKIPDDHLLTDEQIARCERADTLDAGAAPRMPIPTQLVSNGEYPPLPQTRNQQRVEARVNDLADAAARKLGVSRRAFLMGTGGMAASFLAMNEIYGPYFDIDP